MKQLILINVLNERLNINRDIVNSSKKLQFKAMEMADYVMCRSYIDNKHIANMGIDSNKVSVYRGAINVKAIPFKKRNRLGKILFLWGICIIRQMKMRLNILQVKYYQILKKSIKII